MATVTTSPTTDRAPQWCPATPRTDRPRITLVVDHPLRDLPGMVLLATHLARCGAVCYLTPLNLCEREVSHQVPDFVLVNYYRKNFAHFFRALASAGTGIGVLDTEGGVLESAASLCENLVAEAPLRAAVACYCCWGPKVADYLVEHDWFTSRQVRVTGCPRTDFYAAPFRAVAAADADVVAPYADNLILLNANFSIGNPAFLSDEEQFELLVQRLEHPPDRVRQWQAKEKAGLQQLAALAVDLARRFPQATVVYRPHPFERMATYDTLLPPLENLHCVRTGSIDAWLLKARVVIQRSCSTSIEAGMAGTVALMPAWIPTPFERPAANRTSVVQQTPEDLFRCVDQVLSNEFAVPDQVTADLDEVIRDWFDRVDGQAHRRVANAVVESVDTAPAARAKRFDFFHRSAYGLDRRLTSSKRWRGVLRALCGLPSSWSLLRWQDQAVEPEKLERWQQSAKQFDIDQVRRIALPVLASQGLSADTVRVDTARQSADYQFGYAQGCAIKIAPPETESSR